MLRLTGELTENSRRIASNLFHGRSSFFVFQKLWPFHRRHNLLWKHSRFYFAHWTFGRFSTWIFKLPKQLFHIDMRVKNSVPWFPRHHWRNVFKNLWRTKKIKLSTSENFHSAWEKILVSSIRYKNFTEVSNKLSSRPLIYFLGLPVETADNNHMQSILYVPAGNLPA